MVYISYEDPFEEVEKFIAETARRYRLETVRLRTPMKEALTKMLREDRTAIKVKRHHLATLTDSRPDTKVSIFILPLLGCCDGNPNWRSWCQGTGMVLTYNTDPFTLRPGNPVPSQALFHIRTHHIPPRVGIKLAPLDLP